MLLLPECNARQALLTGNARCNNLSNPDANSCGGHAFNTAEVQKMYSNIKDKFVVYQDNNDNWRWTFLSGRNGRRLADSGQSYARRFDCQRPMRRGTNNAKVCMQIFGV